MGGPSERVRLSQLCKRDIGLELCEQISSTGGLSVALGDDDGGVSGDGFDGGGFSSSSTASLVDIKAVATFGLGGNANSTGKVTAECDKDIGGGDTGGGGGG